MAGARYNRFNSYEDEHEAARRRLERRLAASGRSAGGAAERPSSRRASSPAPSERSRGSERARSYNRSRGRIDPLAHSLVGAPASVLTGGIHIPRFAIVIAGALLLVAIFAAVGAIERSCSADHAEPAPIETDAGEPQAPEPAVADFSLLPSAVPADQIESLKERADDERVVAVVNNAQGYLDTFGEARGLSLIELAAEDPEALDFVAGLLDAYPAAETSAFDGKLEKGSIPLLYQWDTRWGYGEYCAGPIGSTGCCPASLSMVYMGLTGRTDKTPADMAAIATENGYAEDDQGTYGHFLTDMAGDFGLQCEQFTPSAANFLTYLESGYVVICNVGPGDFTESGHFFVATGLADDGTVEINDPYSSVTSAKTWSAERIAGQSIAMYAFRVAA